MKQADVVLQEIWKIKDTAFQNAGNNPVRFVQLLRERSQQLREGLHLRVQNSKAPSTKDATAGSQSR